jgi:putative RNA 2'-phosphotransferase
MKKYSRFLSLILRHQPEVGDLTLDGEGWAKVSDVMASLRTHVGPFNRDQLDELVSTNDKQRFRFNDTGDRIRANQGHSVEVDLGLISATPPPILYHGTKRDFLDAIMAEGLKPGQRQHVHLSDALETANAVANRRRGASVILLVDTAKCPTAFFRSDNGVWLTDAVPAEALSLHF